MKLLKHLLILCLFVGCKNSDNREVISTKENDSINKIEEANNKNLNSLEGEWEWKYNPNNEDLPEVLFTISIQKTNNNEFLAQYCAVAQKGNKIDCSNDKEHNIKGTIKNNKIEAIFYSFFDNKKTKANVELTILNDDSIEWKITKEVNFEFYAPKKCILTRKKIVVETTNKNKLINLPFDYDKYLNLCYLQENLECKQKFPFYSSEELQSITNLITSTINKTHKPGNIYCINNNNSSFETYVFTINDENESYINKSILINVKNNKIISSQTIEQSIDGDVPEDVVITYKTFVINKDLSIFVYDKKFGKINNIIEKYKITNEGLINKIK